jgi:hypothetical protein
MNYNSVMKNLLSKTFVCAFLVSSLFISACHDEEDTDSDKLNPYVDTPANPILTAEGSLHLFDISSFIQDPLNVDNDIMVLTFNNFTPATSNDEPDEDENDTLNDLGWTQNDWNEDAPTNWLTISSPASSTLYQKTRQYRVLEDGLLSAAITTLNRPVYEAIDKNIYERQLGAVFVWDFGNYTDEAGEDVSGEDMIDYENFYNFDLLDHVSIWAENAVFSSGAKIYGATRSIAADTLTVESVENNGNFSLSYTKFGTGQPDLESAIAIYPQYGTRMEYRFTVDYATHSTVYITFDTATDMAYLWQTQGGSVVFSAPYTLHSNPSYLEIDTASLAEDERIILGGIPAYFNPVIIGPYTEDGTASNNLADKSYFYGKHYIKTNAVNRLNLSPIFFFNPIAKTDIQNTFKAWREERHLDGP